MLPFVLGLFIGAGITKNKYVFYIFIIYIIFMVVFNLIGNKIIKIKQATDKKMELQKTMVEEGNRIIDYIEPVFNWLNTSFDRYFPVYTFLLNFSLFCFLIFLVWKQYYTWFIICFFALNVNVILNNIWRRIGDKNEIKTSSTNT